MSVVNDVLKNLHQRHAREKLYGAIPFSYEQEKPRSYWLLILLLGALLICAAIAINIWFQVQRNNISINLPADLFLIDENRELSSNGREGHVKTPVAVDSSKELLGKKLIDKKMVTKSAQSKAVDIAVSAIKQGDKKTVKAVLAKTPRVIRDEINLRLMLKENPQQVLPYIQSNHKNFAQQADLLAMAAQAEQRSGNHASAIELYKRLIVLQPKDARWRAGIAISLEVNGKTRAAQRMYALAMNLPNLPRALHVFSEQRLKILR